MNNIIVYNSGVENVRDMGPKQYMDALTYYERKIRIQPLFQITGTPFADGKSFGSYTCLITIQNQNDKGYWILFLIDVVLHKLYSYSYISYGDSWTQI